MRKTDYLTLAAALANEIRSADTWLSNPAGEVCQENRSIAIARKNTAERIAKHCAEHLSVDKRAFLEACGLKL